MKNILILLIVILSFSSCKKESYFEATVLGIGSCGQRTLQFEESLANIGYSPDNIYMSNELPETYQIEGSRVQVQLREPILNEFFLCPDYGIRYRQIHITNIKD